MTLRENWRVVVLTLFVLLSAFALFVPGGVMGDGGNAADSGPTNLNFGIDLSGGLRIQGTLDGITAENVNVSVGDASALQQAVVQELGVDPVEVEVRVNGPGAGTVEVFGNETEPAELAAALQAAGYDVSTNQIRTGVTRATLENAADRLDRKIDKTGLGGGGASVATTATGRSFLQVQTPETNLSAVQDTITRQGRVVVDAMYPVRTDNGTEYRRTQVLTRDDFLRIGQARQAQEGNPPHVSVTLRDAVARNFSDRMQEWGFAQPGGVDCLWRGPNTTEPGHCLMTVVDGNVTYAAGMNEGLSGEIRSGSFIDSPTFVLQTTSFAEAQQVKLDLETGALPAPFRIQSFDQTLPSTGDRFKLLSVVTGLAAWIALSGVVFLRYRRIEVAVPMLLTAAAEVFILLGFAATFDMALNLSHIAGFIAVIGTGVDDLVIIADEILQEGTVATGRVFQNRFRKAFWVIGAAAATTIVAMSPLIALGLGDLSGFAIVTIVGVLIGVLVTRPAYGDVLRNLLVRRED